MSKLNVLISGGGVAGPCLAWWLNKGIPATITIVERAPEPRTSGQAVDIRDVAVDVIQRMGLEETIRSKHTTEEGICFVYADGKTKASFPSTGDSSNQGITSEFEILRGDLARIFYEATKDFVTYEFNDYVTEVQEQENGKLEVTFANRLPRAEYDLVVGADGMISNTRRVIFGKGPDGGDYLRPLGQYCSFFTISKTESDTTWAQWYNAPKGRLVVLRPDQYSETRAYLAVTDSNLTRFVGIEKAMRKGPEAQQKWLEEEFVNAGWQSERVVAGMKTAKDFYMQQIAQVKMVDFTRGHVALIGDAGYCPSPISGMGTSAAIVGAYVLAGELSKAQSDIPKALEQYQSTLRPFIDQIQRLPLGAPQIVNPQSELGIMILNNVAGLVASSWVRKIGSTMFWLLPSKKWSLPEYPGLAK